MSRAAKTLTSLQKEKKPDKKPADYINRLLQGTLLRTMLAPVLIMTVHFVLFVFVCLSHLHMTEALYIRVTRA